MCRTGSAACVIVAETKSTAAQAIPLSVRRVVINLLRCREAVEQSIAAGALQVVLAAAAVWSARGMRRIPRQHGWRGVQPLAVMVAHHGGAGGALGPVAAGAVIGAGKRRAVGLR